VIDTHIHLWRRAEAKQSGILARPYLQRDFLWADYAGAWGGERVERAVQVQVNDFTDPLWEAAFAAGVAESEPALGAYVTWAAVEQPYLDDELDDVEPAAIRRDDLHLAVIAQPPTWGRRGWPSTELCRSAPRRLGRIGALISGATPGFSSRSS